MPEHNSEQWSAVAEWYHAYFTGLVMTMATRRSASDAAELVFGIFRKQHLERFLPGLQKLGIAGMPPAVAAARYHYLSNAIGGVKVEYFEESSKKAWVRYPPPRWAWLGTAICAIPTEVSRAMLQGWHAHNGVSLGCPRLGFVCTKQTMDGQPGLEGYYLEHDRDLAPDERLRFSPGEEMPDFDPATAPQLPAAGWPQERVQKARRNYAMEYVRTALPVLVAQRGPQEAAYLGGITGKLVGMQFYDETAEAFGISVPVVPSASSHASAEAFARFMVAFARAQGDEAEIVVEPVASTTGADGSALHADASVRVRQTSWKLMAGVPNLQGAEFESWNQLLEGALAAYNRRLALRVERRLDRGDDAFEWTIESSRR